MSYIIKNKSNDLLWSNSEGWTDSDNYDTFSESERNELTLPINGQWEHVPWKTEEQYCPVCRASLTDGEHVPGCSRAHGIDIARTYESKINEVILSDSDYPDTSRIEHCRENG